MVPCVHRCSCRKQSVHHQCVAVLRGHEQRVVVRELHNRLTAASSFHAVGQKQPVTVHLADHDARDVDIASSIAGVGHYDHPRPVIDANHCDSDSFHEPAGLFRETGSHPAGPLRPS